MLVFLEFVSHYVVFVPEETVLREAAHGGPLGDCTAHGAGGEEEAPVKT